MTPSLDHQEKKQVTSTKVILYCSWASNLAEGASRIIIPVYFTRVGFTSLEISVSFFVFEIFGLLANFSSGIFANRFGYKPAFVGALCASTAASAIYLLIDDSWSRQLLFFTVILARAFRGIGEELLKTTCSSYIRQGEKKKRGKGIQTLLGGKETVKGVGTLLGGLLLNQVGLRGSFLVLGLTTLSSAGLALLMLPRFFERKRVTYRGFFKVRRPMRLLSICRVFLYAGRDVWIVVALPLYALELGLDSNEVAAVMAAGLIIFGVAQAGVGTYLSSQIRKKIRELIRLPRIRRFRPLLLWPLVLLALLNSSFMMIDSGVEDLIAFVLVFNIIAGLATIPHNHLHVKFARKKRASMDISFYKTASQLGKGCGVLLSGLLYQSYGFQACLVSSILFAICGFFVGLRLQKSR